MAQLNYKTRGMCNPKGLPRVYFCAHPTDWRLFDEIADSILAFQNCAVWYTDEEITDPEDHFLSLSQMQLFVMPVTSELLTTYNFALNTEFSYAIEHHIPVLPLMQEQGLETLFNQKCGNLQFLDKYNRDDTAISYEEKLEKFLSSVLVGDELAKKVRSAFDAYVFLSYRKKDRRYAQNLMRLIHRNEFCRDIAIWYDEFLTPGENFNDAIHDALCKSDLFVLTVTPNLINEINYIMTVEYPMALQENKPIIPAEMVPTNALKLQWKFKKVPKCVKTESELSEVLMQKLERLAIRENDHSPEHNYLIGLAYLSGIDVEVDHERAVKLITGSAEAGHMEAISKLVEMYSTGLGVERSYKNAIAWQEKKIVRMNDAYRKDPSAQTLHDLVWAMLSCGDILKELGILSDALPHYKETVRQIKASPFLKMYRIVRDLSIAFSRLGGINRATKSHETAAEYYKKSIAARELLAKKTSSSSARNDLSCGYEDLGLSCKARGNYDEAAEYFEKCLAIRELLAKESHSALLRRNLSLSYEHLGSIRQMKKDYDDAVGYYEKSLAIREQLANESPTVQARRDLSSIYACLGDVLWEKHDNDGAAAFFEKVLSIRKQLVKESPAPIYQNDLAITYYRLSLVSHDPKEKADCVRKALEIGEELCRQCPDIALYQDNLAIYYNNLGDACKKRNDTDGALDYYQKGLSIREQLALKSPTDDEHRALAAGYNKLGDICKEKNDFDGALDYYQKGLSIREQLALKSPTDDKHRALVDVYNKLGDICKEKNDFDGALDYYQKGLSIREQLVQESPTLDARSDLASTYIQLGDVLRSKKDNQGSAAYYRKALAIREQQAKESSAPTYRNSQAICYHRLFLVASELPDKNTYIRKAIEITEEICGQYPDNTLYQNNLKLYQKALK